VPILLETRSNHLKKAISIVCYVVSGFFFYGVCLLAFINEPPIGLKFGITGGFCILALMAFGLGLVFAGFRDWKHNLGIILAASGGFAASVTFTIGCLMMTPEFRQVFPKDLVVFFSDYTSGISCVAGLSAAGVTLLIKTRKRTEPIDAPDRQENAPASR
jgi:hypothetical protein